jgi:hypothetical protein
MAFEKGNRLWDFVGKHGRNYKFTPEQLWNEALAYFQWIEDNPLYQDELVTYQGVAEHEPVKKMRAMTIIGYCLFADLDTATYFEYRKNPEFVSIITRIENFIREQKFTGAAAELLNPNIIARDLGLVDKTEVTNPGATIDEVFPPELNLKSDDKTSGKS